MNETTDQSNSDDAGQTTRAPVPLTPNQLAGIARGAARSEQLKQQIEDAMRVIEKEMAANDGIYPGNGGAVTLNEVSRRAKCHPTTLHKPHNGKLKELVDEWIKKLKQKETVGRVRVRRALEQTAQDWRKKYQALQNTHIATNLRLQQLEHELDQLRKEKDALLAEFARHTSSKVIPIGYSGPT